MKIGGILKVFLGAAILAAASGLWAADHYKVVNGPKEFYFGHISLIEEVPGGTGPNAGLPGTLGRILVDLQLENHCGRDLAPLEVWFWVAGFRHGQLVQAVRGHPFDPIPRDGEEDVHIALPGSIDWYDRIEVRVLRTDEL